MSYSSKVMGCPVNKLVTNTILPFDFYGGSCASCWVLKLTLTFDFRFINPSSERKRNPFLFL